MALYRAIDLHSHNNVTLLLDEQDQGLYQKRLPNACATILEQLAPIRRRFEGSWWNPRIIGIGWSIASWTRGIGCIWPSPLRSSSIAVSSIPMTIPTPAGWPICCGSVCYRRATSILKPSGRCGIYCVSGAIWPSNRPPMCSAFRTSLSVTRDHG
jgi:hypothetical protein